MEICEVCSGTGAKIGSKMRICSTCGGRGQVSVCPNCGGDDEVISEYCTNCRGEEQIQIKKNIKVKVPPGVSSGSILRVAGEGDAGPRCTEGPATQNVESTVATVAEPTAQPEDQNDAWKKLKDIAG
ncbi:hypothetical protein JHK87_021938 [Glycine soja]|nr:hypothetical protein JHK87_021938 [Glycine soja]